MRTKGFLIFVLHTHQPYVAQPGDAIQFGEEWLFEAITESYIPLLDMCQRLLADGIGTKLTFSLTPTLTSMLRNPVTQWKYLHWIKERISTVEKVLSREHGSQIAERMHLYRFQRAQDFFERLYQSDLIVAFRRLQESGLISLLGSAATHAYLPLWQPLPDAVKLQVAVGMESHCRTFGKRPLGFWLPECGIYPGVDKFLYDCGVRFAFVDGHALLNACPRPLYRIHAPAHTPAGVAMFAREAAVHDQVWRKTGYPGDPAYLAPELDAWTGLRIRCSDEACGPYNPVHAYSRCLEHARQFVSRCREHVEYLSRQLDREPNIVAMFDTEHFGHWWHEGPMWLDLALRMIASEAPELSVITAEDYLRLYLRNQEVTPSMSSWGWQGYGETWLMGNNDWIYRELYQASDNLHAFLHRSQPLSPMQHAAANQYLREFLLAQSSDWAYMLHAQQNELFVTEKLRRCFANMRALLQFMKTDSVDGDVLHRFELENPVFSSMDLLQMYAG